MKIMPFELVLERLRAVESEREFNPGHGSPVPDSENEVSFHNQFSFLLSRFCSFFLRSYWTSCNVFSFRKKSKAIAMNRGHRN